MSAINCVLSPSLIVDNSRIDMNLILKHAVIQGDLQSLCLVTPLCLDVFYSKDWGMGGQILPRHRILHGVLPVQELG